MFESIREDFKVHGRSLRSGGFWTLVVYRFGRWSLSQRSPLLRSTSSRVYAALHAVTQLATGIVLERETEIGKGFHIIHSGMISIHPRAVIGERVGMMHGVTLGTNMGTGAPVIGNDVFIGCNASILGDVNVGDGARVSANSLVINDVPPGGVAIGVPAKTAVLDLANGRHAPERHVARSGRSS